MTGLAMTTALLASTSNEWGTPASLYGPLDDEFRFDLDVCASSENAKCERYFSAAENGLWQPWAPRRCWMNPPYGSAVRDWVHKAYLEAGRGALVVALLPVRTDTAWYHEYVLGHAEVRFVRGRVHFELPGRKANGRCPFPSVIAIWRPPSWVGGRP